MQSVAPTPTTQRYRISRAEQLQHLQSKLEKSLAGDGTDFEVMFRSACSTLELSDADAAAYLKTSRPTVNRWKTGRSQPHPIGRESVLRSLLKKTREKLQIAESF